MLVVMMLAPVPLVQTLPGVHSISTDISSLLQIPWTRLMIILIANDQDWLCVLLVTVT